MLKSTQESISEILGINEKNNLHDNGSNVKHYRTYRKTKDNITFPIVVLDDSVNGDDFYATIATYYENIVPLSNTMYIFNEYTSKLFDSFSKRKLYDSKNSSFIINMLIGAIIGEIYTLNNGVKSKNNVAEFSYARNTFSYFICRSFYLYENNLESDLARFLWNKFCTIFNKEYSDPVVETVIFIKNLLTRDFDKNLFIDIALADSIYNYSKSNKLECKKEVLKSFINNYPSLKEIVYEINGPYDNRINVFYKIVSEIEKQSKNFRIDEIAIAYFCNEIASGSYLHFNILKEMVNKYPAVLIWYSFFSTISYNQTGETSNLIIKLKRDITSSFSFEERPTCDISMDEYEILTRTNINRSLLNLSSNNLINISILPGVNINITFNSREVEDSPHILNQQAIRLLKEATLLLELKHNEFKRNR